MSELPSNWCYGIPPVRPPHKGTCERGYYAAGILEKTDGDWDDTGVVCCYSGPGTDPWILQQDANYYKQRAIDTATVGKSYNQVVNILGRGQSQQRPAQ